MSLLSVVIALAVLLPVAAILWLAATGGMDSLPHLFGVVFPRAAGRTLELLVLTGFFAAFWGIATAWVTTACDFPFRRLLTAALVLPLAIPGYLAAYAFGEFLDYTGPVQAGLRALFGFKSMREYWFPDIRSMGGAVLVLSSVLYPYVFLACRAMFLMQGRAAADVARTLGAGPLKVFFRVQLPMARPAIAVGLSLVMMESLNDIGTVEYLGVNTLTFAIYDSWLNRGSLGGAAQLACLLLLAAGALIAVERAARRRQRFASGKTTTVVHDAIRIRLKGARALLATLVCLVPVLLGFVIPVSVLGGYALRRLDHLTDSRLLDAVATSMVVSGLTAILAVALGFLLAYSGRTARSPAVGLSARVASLGYGVPGTVLALGVLLPFAAFDNVLDQNMRALFGVSTGLLLSGTGFAIIYALTVRFLTMAEGSIDSGFQKLSPHLDMAARTLGRTRVQALVSVLLPNLRPAILTAILLVFIESLKELSATILLRPFNFNTLATLVCEDASRAKVEDASVGALIIILAGLIPALLVSRSLDRAR
ncbi:ABC transporter permease [Gellertiella hungarica]|uniref:ABC transporter permease n=1 Tax=Gellertiella hungarica TaxID=1572859 RepID=UPI001FE7C44F|nr:iron ABC transporter permease [Gellertiella hungarica]